MPYKLQGGLETPEHSWSKVWRYMSLAKFLSLLEYRALHFVSVRYLRENHDVFEGEITEADWNFLSEFKDPDVATMTRDLHTHYGDLTYVNCWRVSEYEDSTMWFKYVERCDGVAVQSDFRHMRDCLAPFDKPVHIGMVKYVNFDEHLTYATSSLPYATLKRPQFATDQEIRMIYYPYQGELGSPIDFDDFIEFAERHRFITVVPVQVDIAVLLQQVYVSPDSEPWLLKLIRTQVERAGLNPDIVQPSTILQAPKHRYVDPEDLL